MRICVVWYACCAVLDVVFPQLSISATSTCYYPFVAKIAEICHHRVEFSIFPRMLSVSSVVTVLVLANIAQISSFSITRTSSHKISNRDVSMKSQSSTNDIISLAKKCSKVVASSFIALNLIGNFDVSSVKADEEVAATPAATVTPSTASTKFDDIPKVPLYTKKGSDTQAYSDIGRGFRMLR